jgi:hypothetical protein
MATKACTVSDMAGNQALQDEEPQLEGAQYKKIGPAIKAFSWAAD